MRKRKSHIRGKVGGVFGTAGFMIRKYSRSSVRENSMSLYGVMMDMVQSWGLGLEQECGLGVPLGVDAGGGGGRKEGVKSLSEGSECQDCETTEPRKELGVHAGFTIRNRVSRRTASPHKLRSYYPQREHPCLLREGTEMVFQMQKFFAY